VTIVGENKPDKFNDKYPRKDLLGAVAIEPMFKGEIRSNWYVNSATTFLIDKNGILQCVSPTTDFAEQWLDDRVK
jgi:hypothetical protein